MNVECSSPTEDRLAEGADDIAQLYRLGYSNGSITEELDGWAAEAAWPEG